jgi:hypothetical protein
MREPDWWDVFLLSLAVGLITVALTVSFMNEHYKPLAIEHGCAEYNSTSGEFEWKGE